MIGRQAGMAETKKRTGPVTFFNQVRQEGRKVTWTPRKETMVTTIMVLIMVLIMAGFFFLTDTVLSWVLRNGFRLLGAG